MTLAEVLETLDLHGRSAVVNVEPKTVAEWAAVVRAGLEVLDDERAEYQTAKMRQEFWAKNPHACGIHYGARTACGQCLDAALAARHQPSSPVEVEAARPAFIRCRGCGLENQVPR